MSAYRLSSAFILATLIACAGDTDGETDTDTTDTDVSDVETDTPETSSTIVDIVVNTDRFSILEAAVIKAGLVDALGADGLTVFAPNNDAFTALLGAIGADSLDDLSAEQLRPILAYHVLGARVAAADAVAVANGAGKVTGLGGTIAVTPTDAGIAVDGADVIATDIEATNGIIHEIDAVILPSITDVVASDPELSTLLAAISAADGDASAPNLAGVLDGDGSFTVFAPVNDAFDALLTANGLDSLGGLVDAIGGTEALIGVLQHHVLASRVLAADAIAADGTSVSALNGTISVDVQSGSVVLNAGVDAGVNGENDATVIVTDLLTANGIIHKVDAVLVPAAKR